MIPNQPKVKPPTHTCETSHLHFPPCTLYTPLQIHVYLIDKFSLYNLMMAKFCGRNM